MRINCLHFSKQIELCVGVGLVVELIKDTEDADDALTNAVRTFAYMKA